MNLSLLTGNFHRSHYVGSDLDYRAVVEFSTRGKRFHVHMVNPWLAAGNIVDVYRLFELYYQLSPCAIPGCPYAQLKTTGKDGEIYERSIPAQ